MAALFAKKKKEAKEKTDDEKQKEQPIEGVSGRVLASQILRDPVITEKAHSLNVNNTYAFFVNTGSSKEEIRKAVEQLYSVQVMSVRTVTMKPRKRVFGKVVGHTKKFKKAFVKLNKGQSLDIFDEAKE